MKMFKPAFIIILSLTIISVLIFRLILKIGLLLLYDEAF